MNEKNSLQLTFITNTGEKLSFNVPRAKQSITAGEVTTAMNGIMAANIVFVADKGRPVSISGAVLTETGISVVA